MLSRIANSTLTMLLVFSHHVSFASQTEEDMKSQKLAELELAYYQDPSLPNAVDFLGFLAEQSDGETDPVAQLRIGMQNSKNSTSCMTSDFQQAILSVADHMSFLVRTNANVELTDEMGNNWGRAAREAYEQGGVQGTADVVIYRWFQFAIGLAEMYNTARYMQHTIFPGRRVKDAITRMQNDIVGVNECLLR